MTHAHETTWPVAQRERLEALLRAQADDPSTTWIGYYCSDAWGRASNGGDQTERVHAGLVQRIDGPLEICTPRGLHATREPHRWRGVRVWVVALLGPHQEEDDKAAALVREIVGEVMPEDVFDPSLAARMGLARAYLTGANLRGAYLVGANLRGANLGGANLGDADLVGANLGGAYLRGANLARANLVGAYLVGAYIVGAYIGGTERPPWLPEQWIVTRDGYVARREI